MFAAAAVYAYYAAADDYATPIRFTVSAPATLICFAAVDMPFCCFTLSAVCLMPAIVTLLLCRHIDTIPLITPPCYVDYTMLRLDISFRC